ncbi:MAG: ABC transporter ATP-binding protein [Chloroflexi bacterium]|nr:ABC transporter ATP-binding protein [Chloroflexota bacterium]
MTAPAPFAVEGVSRTFGSGPAAVQAVRDVSFSVAEREIVAIVGPSGSGKTTLLSIAGGLLTPSAGRVVVLGEDITALGHARRAAFRLRHIGFVFQSFNLLPSLNALENVEVALNLAGTAGRPAKLRAMDILELLALEDRAHIHPNELSGGEQQRLAVARALANRPDVILADEPTASLDSAAGHRVIELMRTAVDAGEARAMVIVTHDTRILDVPHRVLLMDDGRVRPASDADRASLRLPVPG